MKVNGINSQTFGAKFKVLKAADGMITPDEIAKLVKKAENVGSSSDIIQASIGKIFGKDDQFLKTYEMQVLTSINEELSSRYVTNTSSPFWSSVFGKPNNGFKMPYESLDEFIDALAKLYPKK